MIRMSDGENRLEARGGHGFLTGGKGEPRLETEPINKWGQSPFIWRVFAITNLIIRKAFHHGENVPATQSWPSAIIC